MTGTISDQAPTMTPENEALLERFRAGKKVALARAISLVEDEKSGFQDFLHAALETSRFSKRIGFTGPPGSGKTMLARRLPGLLPPQTWKRRWRSRRSSPVPGSARPAGWWRDDPSGRPTTPSRDRVWLAEASCRDPAR